MNTLFSDHFFSVSIALTGYQEAHQSTNLSTFDQSEAGAEGGPMASDPLVRVIFDGRQLNTLPLLKDLLAKVMRLRFGEGQPDERQG
jgi:hypothetical protein